MFRILVAVAPYRLKSIVKGTTRGNPQKFEILFQMINRTITQ
jgi:hypothetical protein